MKVTIHLKAQSQPMEYDEVTNAYEKGSFYCIYSKSQNLVVKIPVQDIFRVTETYS